MMTTKHQADNREQSPRWSVEQMRQPPMLRNKDSRDWAFSASNETSPEMPSRIAVIGDSIAAGLGVKGCAFGDILQSHCHGALGQASLFNLAGTAATIFFSQTRLEELVALRPDCVVIAHGITEAIVRPTPQSLKWIPQRWRKPGWMDPRPYYSRRLIKGLYHRVESAIRWRVRVAILKAGSGRRWFEVPEFISAMKEFVDQVLARTDAVVVLLTAPDLDGDLFPGSVESIEEFRAAVRRMPAGYAGQRVLLCEATGSLDRWNDYFADHFHPNARGHRCLADMLFRTLLNDKRVEQTQLSPDLDLSQTGPACIEGLDANE